jgi:hypothetical protein
MSETSLMPYYLRQQWDCLRQCCYWNSAVWDTADMEEIWDIFLAASEVSETTLMSNQLWLRQHWCRFSCFSDTADSASFSQKKIYIRVFLCRWGLKKNRVWLFGPYGARSTKEKNPAAKNLMLLFLYCPPKIVQWKESFLIIVIMIIFSACKVELIFAKTAWFIC